MTTARLPSWRAGTAREDIETFLDGAEMLPIEQRVAVFDVDGTLWSEQPRSPTLEFLLAELQESVARRPELAERPEYRAALAWDPDAIARLGAVNVVVALVELHAGLTPEAFEARARSFFETARHPVRGVPYSQMRYRPMLELIAELRARHFSVHLAAGAGIESIRAVSERYFGVGPEGVAGAQVGYELVREAGLPLLRRTRELVGDPNPGPAKVGSIQRLLGRRPILAAGDAPGDAELLDYALASRGPSLALLIDHDDADREPAYADSGSGRALVESARRKGWTVVSIRDVWDAVFADS